MKTIIQGLRQWFTSPAEELSRWARFLVFQVRIWRHCIRLLRINRFGTQAAALSYYTVFGLVPAVIVMLMIFQMFPAYRDVSVKVRAFVYEQMNLTRLEYPTDKVAGPRSDGQIPPKISVAEKLDELTDHYLGQLNAGAVGLVSGLVVIYAAIGLLSTIEKAFNVIYRVPTGRSFLKRMVNYWSLLTLGPLLLGVGIHLSTQVMMMKGVHQGLLPYIQPVLPFLIGVVLFFFLYYMLPNTAVRPAAALWGAFVAAVLWTLAKVLFGLYVTKFVPFNVVWGILGIIPLTVFWIYWTWIFILFGLQLTYAVQNLRTLDAAELARAQGISDVCLLANDQTIARMVEFVLRVFEQKEERPVSVEQVAANLQMPVEMARRLLDHLVKGGLLCHTNEPVQGYVPSTDGTHLTLADVSRVVESLSYGQADPIHNPKIVAVFDKIRRELAQYTLKDVLEPFRKEEMKTPLLADEPQDKEGL